jgi:hypothetical protein
MWFLFKNSFLIFLLIIFLIHPYLFFSLPKFIETQTQLFITFKGNISYFDSILKWIDLFYKFNSGPSFNIIFQISFYILPLTFLGSLWLYFTNKKDIYLLAIVNSVIIIFFIFMLAHGNRNFFYPTYISPIYIFLIFNIFITFSFLASILNNILVRNLFILLFISTLLLISYININNILGQSASRIKNDALPFKTFSFIQKNIKVGDKIVYDHFVAIPKEHKKNAGHYWHGYGTDLIEDFNPKYVMFNAEYETKNIYTDRLRKYVQDHNMKLLITLQTPKSKWLKVDPKERHNLYSSSKVFIYVKP